MLVCFFFFKLEIHSENCTIRERLGRLSCAKPEDLMASPHWAGTGLARVSWGSLSRDVGSVSQCCLSHCLASRGLRAAHPLCDSEGFEGKRCVFFSRKSEGLKGDAFGLCCFCPGKKLCFPLLGHCLRPTHSCPEEKGQCRL